MNAIEPEDPPAPINTPATPAPTTTPRLWYTLVSTALILGAYLVLQVAATATTMAMLGLDPASRMGDLVALGVIFSAVPCTFLVLLALGFARDIDPKSWLALVPVPTASMLGWLVFAVVLLQLADLATAELGRSPVPPVMETIITTTRYTTLLWVALVIAAPVFEEVLFRGFLFAGLRRTRIGPWGTIAVTTLLWTLLHVGQYDPYFLGLIALIGILIGFARERTGSLYVPLAIHAVNNLLSILQLSEERDTLVNGLF